LRGEDLQNIAEEIGEFVTESVAPLAENLSEVAKRVDELNQRPEPASGKDGADGKDGVDGAKGDTGEKGADGIGFDVPMYEPGVYREGSIVQAHFGQFYKALTDTSHSVDSEDWQRIGNTGFRICGGFEADRKYSAGDLFRTPDHACIDSFGLYRISCIDVALRA
jgi:hypothetical protein